MHRSDDIAKQTPAEGFVELAGNDIMVDDPDHIVQYRAVALAEGLEEGTEADVLWAWQWLGDHPEVTNRLQPWFALRVAELRTMGRIK